MEDKNKKTQGQSSTQESNRAEGSKGRTHAGSMTPEEAGHLGGTAPRRHGMTREEAGHLGGTAPHKCRGFECQKEHKSSSSSEGE